MEYGRLRNCGTNTASRTYNYTFALNNAKTVQSVVLPNNANVEVLAMTVVP